MGFYTRKKRHFRGHKTNVKGKTVIHPSYIVGEEEDSFYHVGLTHSPKKGKGHPNHRLLKNPRSGEAKISYVRKKVELDSKNNFSRKKLRNFKMSKEDDLYIDNLINKIK